MMRLFFIIAAALSLLLCASTTILWTRSFWAPTDLELGASDHGIAIRAERGEVELSVGRPTKVYYLMPYRNWSVPTLAETCEHHLGGFGVNWTTIGPFSNRRLVMPSWFLVAAFAVPPVVWLLLWRRRVRRIREHLCPKCGYDLRASSGRCPECGTAIPVETGAMA